MMKLRENRHNRVYHLISRIAHGSFCLDADERDRWHVRLIELRGIPGIAGRSYFTLCYLSPLAKAGYVELVVFAIRERRQAVPPPEVPVEQASAKVLR